MICTTCHSRSRGFRCMHKHYHCAAQKRVGNTRLGLLCRGGTALSIPMYIQLLILFVTEIQFTKKKGSKREVNYSMECTQKSTSSYLIILHQRRSDNRAPLRHYFYIPRPRSHINLYIEYDFNYMKGA